MSFYKYLFITVTFSFQIIAYGQNSHKSVTAKRISSAIIVDGNLNETEWYNAPIISEFTQIEPYYGETANFKTEVKILYNEESIYFGVFCEDNSGVFNMRVPNLKRDFDLDRFDVFGIAMDPYSSMTNAVAFQVTPYGTQRDVQVIDGVIEDVDWNTIWKVKTKRTNTGWYAEIEIPFKSLSYPTTNSNLPWNINFMRIHRTSNEVSAYPGYPRSQNTYRMKYSVPITGLRPPKAATNIRVNPYLLERLTSGESPLLETKVGGDVKWGITPNSSLDLTFNTDFAQTDIDQKIINLSRFSIFLPEKREFFLEGSGLFTIGNKNINPFFSRKIGLDSLGNPKPILGGAKYINRDLNRNLAGLYVIENKTTFSPRNHYGVFRYMSNYGNSSHFGTLITAKYSESGDLSSVISLDGNNRLGDKWRLNYMWSYSFIYPDKLSNGHAGSLNTSYLSDNFTLISSHTLISSNYNPEVGFVSGKGFLNHSFSTWPSIRGKILPRIVRSYNPGLEVDIVQNLQDLSLRKSMLSILPVYLSMNDGGVFILNYKYYKQNLNSTFYLYDFEIERGNYNYGRYSAYYRTDQSRTFSFITSVEGGKFYNGSLVGLNAKINYAPIPNIFLSASYELNSIKDLKNTMVNDEKIELFASSLRLALNPNLQLTTFYQYSSTSNQHSFNSRLSWQFAPLSYFRLIYNLNNNVVRNGEAILKVNFMKVL